MAITSGSFRPPDCLKHGCDGRGILHLRSDDQRKNRTRRKHGPVAQNQSHIGKYDGLFARLCIIWHCIKHCTVDPTDNFEAGPPLPQQIDGKTAQEVAQFMEQFLLPHAVAFYFGTLGLSDNHDRLCAIASYILAHQLDKITNRDVQRGDRAMRGLEDKDSKTSMAAVLAKALQGGKVGYRR